MVFAKLQSLHMILALAAVYEWEIDQMDVVTAFLNPKVDGDVYMALPLGIEADKPQVCKLRKSLYGLRQAPPLWYEHIDHFLRSLGLRRCEYDPNVYLSASTTLTDRTDSPLAMGNSKQSAQNDAPIILLLYVDDMLLFSPSANRVTTIKNHFRAKYKMTDLGPVRCFLGIEIERDRSRRILHIHQQRAVRKLLATNGFSDCNGHWTPQPTGSKLRRLDPESESTNGTARALDSDITVSMLSKFSSTPTTEHLSAATYTLLYISATHGQPRYPVQCIRFRSHHAHRLHRLRLRRRS